MSVNPPTHLFVFKVESWALKFILPPPKVVDPCQQVEVTSVNWESQLAGANASVALVSYKWHGIMYDIGYYSCYPVSFFIRCWNVTTATLLWHLPMEAWYVNACNCVQFQLLIKPQQRPFTVF